MTVGPHLDLLFIWKRHYILVSEKASRNELLRILETSLFAYSLFYRKLIVLQRNFSILWNNIIGAAYLTANRFFMLTLST